MPPCPSIDSLSLIARRLLGFPKNMNNFLYSAFGLPSLMVLFALELAACVGALLLLGVPLVAALPGAVPLAYLLGRGVLHLVGKRGAKAAHRRKRHWVAVPLR